MDNEYARRQAVALASRHEDDAAVSKNTAQTIRSLLARVEKSDAALRNIRALLVKHVPAGVDADMEVFASAVYSEIHAVVGDD